jgi:hypothetical protein
MSLSVVVAVLLRSPWFLLWVVVVLAVIGQEP